MAVLFFIGIAVLMVLGFQDVEQSSNDEGQRILEESLRRAAVSCYAIEGSYPASLDYLTTHYGVVIDEEKFAVHYEIFASNLMPEITVVPLKY